MKANLEYRIPDSDQEALRSLLGHPFSPAVFQRGWKEAQPVIASMIAVKLSDGGFIQFTTDDWADTREFALDCFRMRIRRTDDPVHTYYENTEKPVDVETLPVLEPAAPVTQIGVYGLTDTQEEEGVKESVSYDAALLIHRRDAPVLLIFVDASSIAGFVGFLQDKNEVDEKLQNLELQRNIQ